MPLKPASSFRPASYFAIAAIAIALSPLKTSAAQKGARPCDILKPTAPCVAAVSTTRALYSEYRGPLYQVTRKSDSAKHDIGLLPDGYANAAAQDHFCANTVCAITRLYDQSPSHNDLTPAPPGGAAKGPGPEGYDIPSIADALPATLDGHKVYGVAIQAGMGYRNDTPKNTAVHGQSEGVYMVTSALHLNEKCCFDWGNAEVDNNDNKPGHMDAINIMYRQKLGMPDAGLDMEDGIYGHLKVPAGTAFVTDMGVCDGQQTYAIYQGNAQSGSLTSTGTTPLPTNKPGYVPMQQEGAIILGIGGDNSNRATGYFFEGVMTKNAPSSQSLDEVQRNIVAAHYAGQLPQ